MTARRAGHAQASLHQLRLMSGRLDESDPKRLVRHGLFGNRETWRHVRGAGSGAIYELVSGEGEP